MPDAVLDKLWDQDLRNFFALGDEGHILVGNVHADDVDENRAQIVDGCQVPAAQLRDADAEQSCRSWLEAALQRPASTIQQLRAGLSAR